MHRSLSSRSLSSRLRVKNPRRIRASVADTTVFPIAMIVVLTVVLVLLMILGAHR